MARFLIGTILVVGYVSPAEHRYNTRAKDFKTGVLKSSWSAIYTQCGQLIVKRYSSNRHEDFYDCLL